MGGAPRTVAIANGTLAAAVGLGLQLWIPGVVLWIVGHSLAVWERASIRSSCRSSPGTSSTNRCSTCGDAAMLNLAEYRQRPALLADWLPWAGLIAPGVVLNKDGVSSARPAFAAPTWTAPRKAS